MFNLAQPTMNILDEIEEVKKALKEVGNTANHTTQVVHAICSCEFFIKLQFTVKCGKNKRKWEAYRRGDKYWNKI